jgi:hypothetical protein
MVMCGLRRPSASNWNNSGEIGKGEVVKEIKEKEGSRFCVEKGG